MRTHCLFFFSFFFFNDTATTEIYTLSLHDALPISHSTKSGCCPAASQSATSRPVAATSTCSPDRKSTRLNSSHSQISYAVFCLKKKKKKRRYRGGDEYRQNQLHNGRNRRRYN